MAVTNAWQSVQPAVDDASLGPDLRPLRRSVAYALLGVAAIVFLLSASRTIAAPFGDSHDGRNGGVWAAGSRSLREEGPIASRLGTRSPEGGVYANHPPLLYVEAAVFEAFGGETAAAARAPAWVGSLAALALLTALLLSTGLRPGAVGVAVVLVAATPMMLVYGAMLDTPITSFPFGLALLLVWERARNDHRLPGTLPPALAALAVLAGWQSFLVAAVIGIWAIVRLVRRSGSPAVNASFAGGALMGFVLLMGWLLWAFGGTLRPLLNQFAFRTGQTTHVPMDAVIAAIRRDTGSMFGLLAALGVGGLLIGLANGRTRGLACIALVVTVPYPLLFRTGTLNHDYWNYWFLLPIAIGLAAGADRLIRAPNLDARREIALAAAGSAIAMVLAASLWVRPDAPSWTILEGRRAGSVAMSHALGPAQTTAWYAGAIGKPATWLALRTREPAVAVAMSDVPALVESHPDDLVFVGRVQCANGAPKVNYSFESPAALLARPPVMDRCGASSAENG